MQHTQEWLKIFLTAVLASFLTLAVDYFLIHPKLAAENEYWIKHERFEKTKELLEKQIQLFEQIDDGILSLEVKAKAVKINLAKFSAEDAVSTTFKKAFESDFQRLNQEGDKLQQQLEEYQSQLNHFGTTIQMVEFYFGPEVDSLLKPLSAALEQNYDHNLIKSSDVLGNSPESIIALMSRDFETIPELENNRLTILAAMRKEIEHGFKLLYGI